MSYTLPQLRVHQEFAAAAEAGLTPLYACIVGPQYGMHDYTEGSADNTFLGEYDNTVATDYSWPDKTAGSTIDTSSAKLYLEDAVLRYYNAAGAFSVPAGTAAGSNKIRSPSLVLATANDVDRSATFGDRDVAVGDYVKVAWTGASSGNVTSKVAALVAEEIDSVGAATATASNNATQIASGPTATASIAQAGVTAVASGTYDGLADGYITESYRLTVVTGGEEGVAEAIVSSDSATDDMARFVLSDLSAITIGSRGLSLALSRNDASSSSQSSESNSSSSQSRSSSSSNNSSSSSELSLDNPELPITLTAGDYIDIDVSQAFTAPVPTSGGDYTGPSDTTYHVRITQGGVVDTDTILYTVSTSNGVDVSPSASITAAGTYNAGNYGVQFTVSNADQYCTGDIWTIAALADTAGAVRTILLANKLVDGSASCAVGDTLTVTLGLKDNVEAPAAYYTMSDEITVSAGMQVTGSYLNEVDTLTVISADMYVEYKELLISNTTAVGSLTSASDVEDALGPVVPANKLAYGVYCALLNAGGQTVYYVATPSDDLAGYSSALNVLSTNQDVYSLVPLSKDSVVQALFKADVLENSSANNNNWRITWLNSTVSENLAIAVDADGNDILATIVDDTSGTNYVNLHSDNASFVTDGVIAGDIVRYNYRPSGDTVIYDVAIVDEVVTEDELLLLASTDTEFPTEIKIEIWRQRSNASFAAAIAAESTAYASRRVYNIWPDTLPTTSGQSVDGYFLCAALAGLRSGMAPHAPMTRVSVVGFGIPTRSNMFTRTQLDTIAGGGTWLVVSDLTGAIYTRHQVSTDNTDINMREQTVTTNLDSMSRVYRDNLSDLYGRGNVSDDMLNLIRSRITSTSTYLGSLPYPATLGPQLQDYEITELAVDPVLRDHVNVRVVPTLPYPLNGLDMYLTIS